ncbi:MAG TPA: NAD-dependent epimerase/dehydratase family protein [Ignavibacteria bacterium]|nr:NAD-dependent epimerase/dehydratase family protein [Ignavibacteria bacterium]HQY52635.1 NAD-dependent epimerase/dehydratase family protein [Ignavibacteria bacterium]HRB00421.1 NAD-dependent epimerase/dehydratase family protein [Ignavibacteria bacterium]
MKAFITGATGFVGSHLADKLLEKNYDVYCLKRSTSSTKWLDGKNINFIDGDLFSNETLENVIKDMDYVFHVAGVVKSRTAEGFYKSNYESTKNLLEITYKVNPDLKKFVLISSLAATGPAIEQDSVDENSPPFPITTYGLSKLKGEEITLEYKDKLNVTIIAPPAVFGPRDTEIFIYFQTFQKGLNSVIGFKEKYLSLVYVEDLADGIILAAESPESNGEKYFLCFDKAYNWVDIGNVTSKLLGKKAIKLKLPHSVLYTVGYLSEVYSYFTKKAVTLNVEKCKDITQIRWVCSNEKAKSKLGFKPKYTLEESFKKTIDWYKEMKWIK